MKEAGFFSRLFWHLQFADRTEQIKIENLYLPCADLKKIRATHFLQGELASPLSKK